MEKPRIGETIRTVGSIATIAGVVTMLYANPYDLTRLALTVIGTAAILMAIGALLYDHKPWRWPIFHRRTKVVSPTDADIPFPICGQWLKTYPLHGREGHEIAVIWPDGDYCINGELEPRYRLRNVFFNPKNGKVQFTMFSASDGKKHDTETLVISKNDTTMLGRSETTKGVIRYERSRTSGQ